MRLDWSTLLLQTINVLVLVWLLQRFLFRPVIGIIAARKEAAERILADAAAVRTQVGAEVAAITERTRKLTSEGNHILAEARAAATAERTALLEHARQEVAQARDAERLHLEREREQLNRELEAQAERLAITIAERLLARVPARALHAAMLELLDSWLTGLTPGALEALSGLGEPLEIVTATALDAETRAACVAILERHFGAGSPLHFTSDPSLLAGVELRSPHARLRNNWRADLDRIARELSRDDEPERRAVA